MVETSQDFAESNYPAIPVNEINPPARLQQKSYLSITRACIIEKQVTNIKNLLHGTLRAAMRIGMNVATKKLDYLRALHELEKLIELLTCRPQVILGLKTLPCPTRGQITNHYEIQRQLDDYFENGTQFRKILIRLLKPLSTNRDG
jgi:hypothetical protein